jgi:NADH:ubiquinone oxidoreductase subunit 3 (subunit A)
VPRFEYVTGKLLGVLLLLVVSVALMAAMFAAVLYFARRRPRTRSRARWRCAAGADGRRARQLRAATFGANLLPAIAAILLKACLLASLTLFVSTFATSNIFTIFVTVFVYFIGHLQATGARVLAAGTRRQLDASPFPGVRSHCLFPDLHLFDFADEIVTGAAIPARTVPADTPGSAVFTS